MGNVLFLSKMDKLTVLTNMQQLYRYCSLMYFTETWLNRNIPTHCHIERIPSCAPGSEGRDIELLAEGVQSYYIFWEFLFVILRTVYIPLSADAATACEQIHCPVWMLQTKHPDTFLLFCEDFSHSLPTLPNFTQYMSSCTRENKIVDLLYLNIKNAYISAPQPLLGHSDHNLVHLQPAYAPMLQEQPVQKKDVQICSDEACDQRRDCFKSTDWRILCESLGNYINRLTHCIVNETNFCVENTVPSKNVQISQKTDK